MSSFAHLHVHTEFSLLDGMSRIKELVQHTAEMGMDSLAITDHGKTNLLDGFSSRLRLVRQPRPEGSADAVRRAGLQPPYLAVAADTVFRSGDVGLFVEAAAGAEGAIAVRRSPPPGPGRAAVRVEGGLVRRVVDDDPANPLAGAPLWLLGPAVHERLAGLSGPPFELAVAFQQAVDAGARVAAVEIGPTRDLTYPVDLVERNFPYLRGLVGGP